MLLVTGITGHSGSFFLNELVKNAYKHPVRCVVRNTTDTSLIDASGLGIEKVVGDVNDDEFINNVTKGVDTILHIYNIHQSLVILRSAIENNVKRVILIHTTGIYSNFKRASQEYKDIEEEVYQIASDPGCLTKVTILRPTMIYGDLCDSNISKFIKIIDKFRIVPVINGGKSLIQPVNARDLGVAYYAVLMSPEKTDGKSYDLSGEKPLKMIEVFRMISDNLNKRTIFINVPLGFGVLLAKLVKIFTFAKLDYVEKVQRMGENRSYPNDEARRDFNFKPMSFEEGIQIEVKQYILKSQN